jgi:hypothetical protein
MPLIKSLSLKIAMPLFLISSIGWAALPRAIDTTHADNCSRYYYPMYGAPTCITGINSYNTGYYSTGTAPSGHIFQTGQINQNTGNPCIYIGYVQWQTTNIRYAEITLSDPDSGQEKVFASGLYGSAPAPWLESGKTYVFNLINLDYGQPVRIDSVQLNLQGLGCTPPGTAFNNGSGYYNSQTSSSYPATNNSSNSGILYNDYIRSQPSSIGVTTGNSNSGNSSGNSPGILFNDWARQNSQTYSAGNVPYTCTNSNCYNNGTPYNGTTGNTSGSSGILFNDWIRMNGSALPSSNPNNPNSTIYYNNSIANTYRNY